MNFFFQSAVVDQVLPTGGRCKRSRLVEVSHVSAFFGTSRSIVLDVVMTPSSKPCVWINQNDYRVCVGIDFVHDFDHSDACQMNGERDETGRNGAKSGRGRSQ